MATNLHAMIRYRTINKCLRNTSRKWNWEALAEACADSLKEQKGIDRRPSRRTIMYDIDNMRHGKLGYEAPIIYNRADKTFRYENPNFSIHEMPLLGEERQELENALLILKQFSRQENLTGISEIITKLEQGLNLKRGSGQDDIIQFDQSLNAPGLRWLNEIYQSILKKQCLNLTYQAFQAKQASGRIFSPYLLKEFEGRWYIYGFDHGKKAIRCLGLDRIKRISNSLAEYYVDLEFDAKTYTRDVIGVAVLGKEKKCKVLFTCDSRTAPYIKTNPLHPSQKQEKNENEFSLELIPNPELENMLSKFGSGLVVLKPAYLRKRLQKRFEKAVRNYSD